MGRMLRGKAMWHQRTTFANVCNAGIAADHSRTHLPSQRPQSLNITRASAASGIAIIVVHFSRRSWNAKGIHVFALRMLCSDANSATCAVALALRSVVMKPFVN
jgi:hypothetical protein